MDPISHAATGALCALAIPKHLRPSSRFFIPLAAAVGLLPDADVIFTHQPIDFLLLHRGISHALIAVPLLAFLAALIALPLWIRITRAHARIEGGHIARTIWPLWKVTLFFSIILLTHLWLDCVTTYGTMIFLPFSEYRVRLNGLFIVDLLLTIPLVLAFWHGIKQRKYAILALIWVLVYPSTCVALRFIHERQNLTSLSTPAMQEKIGKITNISVLPDIFAPFYWRVIYQTDKAFAPSLADEFTWPQGKSRTSYVFMTSPNTVYQQGLSMLGNPRTPLLQYPALAPETAKSLRQTSRRARAFEAFSLMPIQEHLAKSATGQAPGQEILGIYDLRFGTMFPSIYEILLENNNGNPTFLLEARRSGQQWTQVRLMFSSARLDSSWQNVEPPRSVTWWEKLIGINY